MRGLLYKNFLLYRIELIVIGCIQLVASATVLFMTCAEIYNPDEIMFFSMALYYCVFLLSGLFEQLMFHPDEKRVVSSFIISAPDGAKGHVQSKYYAILASVVVKVAEIALCTILVWAIFVKELSFSETFPFDNMNTRLGMFLLRLSASIIIFFPAFGEEWGWRGYLMPKLIEVMGKPASVIVGGIIWGLWHAPLTLSGHNFGTDYRFYPWLGILIMFVMCILMNAFLTLLTERTKSVYPASFCHMINNNLGGSIFVAIFGSEAFAAKAAELSTVSVMLASYLPILAVTAVVSFVLLLKRKS